jgi:hypothetical protein
VFHTVCCVIMGFILSFCRLVHSRIKTYSTSLAAQRNKKKEHNSTLLLLKMTDVRYIRAPSNALLLEVAGEARSMPLTTRGRWRWALPWRLL